MQPSAPRVFVSHASEDKDRFVLPFAERLRERGLDAWVDRWEMLPGDSLVKRIFEEGLENAQAVVVVLSAASVGKAWVSEELDAAVVKRINTGSRLIPVVLDGLSAQEVPASIRHLLHETVPDVRDIEPVVDRVVRSVLGEPDKPALGERPAYAGLAAARIGSLDKIDSLALKLIGDEAVRDWGDWFMTADFVASTVAALGCGEDDVLDSIEVLHSQGLVRISRTMGPRPGNMRTFQLTATGLERYASAYVADYAAVQNEVVARLAGWPTDSGTVGDLVDAVGAPGLLVHHVVERLACQRLLLLSAATGGGPRRRHFANLSVQLRRLAKQ